MYGAQLIEALRRRDPSLEFFGVGGDRMRAAGCDTVVDAKDLAVVGISEIVSHLPKIYGLFHKLIAEADQRHPHLAIVIDSPAFNWRVARQMRKRGIPVVYYVCPQFWAWRQGRVRLLRKYIDKASGNFPVRRKVLSRSRRGCDLRRPSARRSFAALNQSRNLCCNSPSRSRETVDHPNARQPDERSAHEPAHNFRFGREARLRI